MRALFVDIRKGDVAAVAARLDAHPDLVACTAKAPPRKDDGQSPLQVAIKSGGSNLFAVANLLIDRGANVDFQEVSSVNQWTAPVLHDAIRAAVFTCLDLPPAPPDLPDITFALLTRILEAGADLTVLDSAGNDAITRFALDANQVLSGRADDAALPMRLRHIMSALLARGADLARVDPRWGRSVLDQFAGRPVALVMQPDAST